MYRGLIVILIFLTFSCKKEKEEDRDVLVRYNDKELTYNQVIDMIPQGLSVSDSVALFTSIVEGWIRDETISDFAEKRLTDLDMIERKVRDYRNSLIVQEYLNRMRESQEPKIEEQKIKEYYDLHRKELKLEEPLIRGVFLKINSEGSHAEEIRKLMSSEDPKKIDQLEQLWLDKALEYNYFKDKWVEWDNITERIPYRFGDPETFLSDHTFFETHYGDCSYFLQITDVLNPGEEQPYEFAKIWIADLLTQRDLAEYEKSLISSLVDKAMKEKKLETPGYDPQTHAIKVKNEK